MKVSLLGVALSGVLLAEYRAPAPTSAFDPPPIPEITPEIETGTRDLVELMLDMVNKERCQRDLLPLALNDILSDVGVQHSRAMAEQGFFEHVNPQTGSRPGDRVREAGYDFWTVGENIAAGQLRPEEVLAGWMDSPEHRENILNPDYQEMGLGYIQAPGSAYGFYWTQIFGTQLALRDTPSSVSCEAVGSLP